MSSRSYGNFGEGVLSVGIDDGQTTCTLVDIGALNLDAVPSNFWGVIFDDAYAEENGGAGPGADPNVEIVEAFDVTGNVVDIKRGIAPTSPAFHNTGGQTYRFRIVWTAQAAARAQRFVDIRDFNADPTGANLSTDAIQRAMDEAAGAPIYLAPGTYVAENCTLRDAGEYQFIGDGDGVATVKLPDLASVGIFHGEAGDLCEFLSFEGITIDGNQAEQTNRSIATVYGHFTRLALERVHIANSMKAGIRTRSIRSSLNAFRVRATGSAGHSGAAGEDNNYFLINHDVVQTTVPTVRVAFSDFTGPTITVDGRGAGALSCNPTSSPVRLVLFDNDVRRCGYNAASEIGAAFHGYDFVDGSRVTLNRFRECVNTQVRLQKATDARILNNSASGEYHWLDQAPSENTPVLEISGRSPVEDDDIAIIEGNSVRSLPSAGYGILATFNAGGLQNGVWIKRNSVVGTHQGIAVLYGGKFVHVDDNEIRDTTTTGGSREAVVISNLEDGSLVTFNGNKLSGNTRRVRINSEGVLRLAHVQARGNVSDACASHSLGGCITIENVASVDHDGNHAPNLPAGADSMVVTNIAGDTVTLDTDGEIRLSDWQGSKAVKLDTFAAASSDTLTEIHGGVEGQIVVFSSVDDARDIIFDELGNLNITAAYSLTVTTRTIAFVKLGANWLEVSRSSP